MAVETDVIDRDAPEKTEVPKGQPETVTITKAELAALKREREESQEAARFWADKARAGKEPEPDEGEEDADEGIDISDLLPAGPTGDEDLDEAIIAEYQKDPEKWVDAVSKGTGAVEKLIKHAAKKAGYVSKAEATQIAAEVAVKVAERAIDRRTAKITTDNKLLTTFPELADNKSALFAATAEEFKELVEFDPSAKKNPATLFAAAKAAKARLKAEAKAKQPEDDDADLYDRPDEQERRTRVAAQDGSRGGRPSRAEVDDDHLGPQAKYVIEQMGVKEDKFRESLRAVGANRRKR